MGDILTVYHGSKNGLEGPIQMVAGRNRQTCDFGQGFYMGDEPTQPRTLICEGFLDLVKRRMGKGTRDGRDARRPGEEDW